MAKFLRNTDSNKFATTINPFGLTPYGVQSALQNAIPIWTVLGMTEEQYWATYPPLSQQQDPSSNTTSTTIDASNIELTIISDEILGEDPTQDQQLQTDITNEDATTLSTLENDNLVVNQTSGMKVQDIVNEIESKLTKT